METITKERIYVNVNNKGELTSITYFDKDNKKNKQQIWHTNIRKKFHIHIMDIYTMRMIQKKEQAN